MAKLVSKGNSNFVVGVVSYINDTNPAVTNISMVLNEYDREKKETTTCYLNAAGWDNSVENGPMANMPERIKKAKLAPGSLVMPVSYTHLSMRATRTFCYFYVPKNFLKKSHGIL